MYPLQDDYIPHIDAFLEIIHKVEGLKVQTNVMSTQLFGESNLVFETLNKAISKVYQSDIQCPFAIKVLSGDISEMEIKDY